MTTRFAAAAFGLVGSLVLAGEAFAVPIPATDLDAWLTGGETTIGVSTDDFAVTNPPPAMLGSLANEVLFNSATGDYTYTHTVTPANSDAFSFNTTFAPPGFSNVAGWSFSSAAGAGGNGDDIDFAIDDVAGRILFRPIFDLGRNWNPGEAITFFFVSTKGPGMGQYQLNGISTAQSFAPVPEPGSIALLGSGLVGMYAAIRRRRNLRS